MTRKTAKSKTVETQTEMTERLNMVVSPQWFAAIDRWRAQQPRPPNRSEAIRQLVEIAIQQHEKSMAKKK